MKSFKLAAILLLSVLSLAAARAQELYSYPLPREAVDWCTITLTTKRANGPDLPLALLVGDSITVRYAAEVSAALKDTGAVIAWGHNGFGQSSVPATAQQSGVTSIAVGHIHNVALKNTGLIVAWGLNGDGQTTISTGLIPVTVVAAGGYHSVAISIAPTIATTSANNNLTLAWPDTATGYRVESALSVSPGVSWSTVAGTFQTNGGSISIVLPVGDAQRFFRLTKP